MASVSLHQANMIAYAIPIGLVSYGSLRYGWMWVNTMLTSFAGATGLFLVTCAIMQLLGRNLGRRIQPGADHTFEPVSRALLLRELRDSLRCMLVVACMMAFPVTAYHRGEVTGLVWTLDEANTTLLGYLCQFAVGVLGADAWTYWKHRCLHHRSLYAFHKTHHQFRDPSAFAGFAIHPVETLWTFAPISLWYYLPHWLPLFIPGVALFFLLNAYLHCGYTFQIAEMFLPRVLLNSSAFHNVHHEKVSTHFGEISSLWDYLCSTSPIYQKGLRQGYVWHIKRSRGSE